MESESDLHAEIAAFLAICEPSDAFQNRGSWMHEENPTLDEEDATTVLQEIEELLKPSDVTRLLEQPLSTAAINAHNGTESTGKTITGPLAKPAKRKNAHRERVKKELTYLRQKVIDLETQWNDLRRGAVMTQNSNTEIVQKPVWKAVVERQLLGRKQAEAENERLRALLKNQRELAIHLEQSLRTRLTDASVAYRSNNTPQPTYFSQEDSVVYEQYLNDLDMLYTQVDKMLDETGLSALSMKTNRTTRSGGCNGSILTCVEIVDVDVIPFNVYRSGKAFWQSMLLQCRRSGRLRYSPVPQPKDTIAVKFRLQCNANSSLTCNLVMRRYIEKERQVMVWRMLSEGEGELTGMLADETGWVVLCDDPSSPEQSTIVKFYARMVPKPVTSVRTVVTAPDVEKFAGLYVSTNDVDMFEMGCIMENLLLEESIGIQENQE